MVLTLKYLEDKQKAQELQEQRVRVYNDVACLLWYKVAYDDVLSYKKAKLEEQKEPFRVFQWGDHNLIFGPIKALTSADDKEKFCKVAQAELRDRGYGAMKVSVYPDAIIVSN